MKPLLALVALSCGAGVVLANGLIVETEIESEQFKIQAEVLP